MNHEDYYNDKTRCDEAVRCCSEKRHIILIVENLDYDHRAQKTQCRRCKVF